jgi:hypothetical protein
MSGALDGMMRVRLDSTSEPMTDPATALDDEYELSPMQQGMLYDTIASPEPGMYCIVVSYRLNGSIDVPALFDAWRTVVARHPILRTSFHWHEQSAPTQAVHRAVELPVVEIDWRTLSETDQRTKLAELLEAENRRGFDVTRPPLMRLSLVRCADNVYELVVTHHHLLLDGSCKPLLFAEVFAAYEALRRHEPMALDTPTPYRCFIEWLREQDRTAAERFWRDELAGFAEPTPLWPRLSVSAAGTDGEHSYREHHVALDVAETDRLRSFARSHRLTLNTVVSGAWALLLGHASRRDDVVFGATVNAQPPDLDGIETMLGLFINTLPVRFQVPPAAKVADWLRGAQLHQTRARDYDYTPLSSLQQWSGVARGLPLFESIIVFENNLGFGADSERHGSVEVTDVRAHIRNSLPLTLRCVPGRSLSMQLLHETGRFSSKAVTSIAGALVHVLRALAENNAENSNATVAQMLERLDDFERREAAQTASAFQQAVRNKLSQRRRSRSAAETSGGETRES